MKHNVAAYLQRRLHMEQRSKRLCPFLFTEFCRYRDVREKMVRLGGQIQLLR